MSKQEAQIEVARQAITFFRALSLHPTFELQDAATERLREEMRILRELEAKRTQPELELAKAS